MILNELNFKNGILAKPLNDNFKLIYEALKNERLSIAGYGISYGLGVHIDKLQAQFENGHVVDKQGEAFHIGSSTLTFDPPETEVFTEEKDVLFDGAILLSKNPYGSLGISEIDLDRIQVFINNNRIDVTSIEKNKITINKKFANSKAIITYNYAKQRIDQVVLNDLGQLVINKGISSESPTIPSDDSYFCVSCFHINPFSETSLDNIFYSALEKVEHEDHLRNIYTNSQNELFLNGLKVKSLGFIYFEKPVSPQNNMLWYDYKTNQLYAYMYNEWVALQNQTRIPMCENKIFSPADFPTDKQTFIFHKTDDLNMRFIPNKNALKVILDQYTLFSDQFHEISYAEALQDQSLRSLLSAYGYTLTENFSDSYENVGIGFRLTSPVDVPGYLEAQVTHFVNDAEVHARHQRSANFIRNAYIQLDADQTEFETEIPYRYGENQIEIKTSDKNLFNRFDYDEVGTVQGDLSTHIVLRNSFGYPVRLHYTITTNIYSYDHVAKLLERNDAQ